MYKHVETMAEDGLSGMSKTGHGSGVCLVFWCVCVCGLGLETEPCTL